MQKEVLLIIHDLYQNDVEFPIGIGYLAAVLQKHGYKVEIACQDLYHWTDEELVDKWLKNKTYAIIGIGFLSARFKETVLPLCHTVNKYKGNALLVLGAQGATATPEYILRSTKADIAVLGEAEETIIELMENLDNYKNIKGLAYRVGNKVRINERRQPIKDLDSIPFPAWDLFPMDKYTNTMLYMGQNKNEKSFPIISSRGCTANCKFCWRMEKGIRFRSIKNLMEEMSILYHKYGVTYFIFQDELFIANIKRLREFVQGLKDYKLFGKIKYNVGGIRANIVTDELARLLKESNCTYANIGFEAADDQCLKEMNKHITAEENVRCAETFKKYGVVMGLNFIWGTPSDNEETLKKRVDFLRKYNTYAELRTIRPITTYPNSPFYYDALEQGLLTGPEDFYDKFKNSDLISVNFTKIPTDKAHVLLYKANVELILDHVKHSTMTVDEANDIINGFFNLYFMGFQKFRGARKYGRDKE